MKRYFLIIAIVVLPMITLAQTEFKKIYNTFKDKKGVSIVQLDEDLIDLYKRSHLAKETEDMIKKLKSVNILNVTINKEEHTAENINKLVNKSFNFDTYKVVKSSTYNRGFSKMYVKKKNDKVNSLVVINSNWREYNLILITGEIDMGSLSKLTYALNIDGIEKLNNVNSKEYRFFYGNNNHDEEIDKIKSEANRMKRNLKEKRFFEGKKFNEEEFEEFWEDFGEKMANWGENMAEWGEKLAESIEKNMENIVIVDDDDFNISQSRSGKTTIKISPDNKSIYILDGNKVANSRIKSIEAGKINRISVVKSSKGKKDGENYIIIYTGKPFGKFISYNSGILKFKYLGKIYEYDSHGKDFPGYLINGKKTNYLDKSKTDKIIQIRLITKAEKEAFKCKKQRILIETK